MNTKMLCVASALLFASATAFSAELLVTTVPAKDKLSIAFDLASDGDVSALNFKLNVPGLADSKAKLPQCVAELPSGFDGGCSVLKGGVYVYAVSNDPAITIPAGVSSIGKVVLSHSVPSTRAKADSKFTVSELAVYDNKAQPLNITARIDSSFSSEK